MIQCYAFSVRIDVFSTTTMAWDTNILLPVQNGNVADCRQQNVKFIWVQLSIDFVSLLNVPNNVGPTTLCTEYYIELPQTT